MPALMASRTCCGTELSIVIELPNDRMEVAPGAGGGQRSRFLVETARALAGRGARVVVADIDACEFMAGTQDLQEYRRSGIRAVQSTPLRSRTGAG